jgi:YHS domain-containing protein
VDAAASLKEREMAKDPVCHMDVDPPNAAAQSKYREQTYYFCAVGCKTKFDREPEKYLTGGAKDAM